MSLKVRFDLLKSYWFFVAKSVKTTSMFNQAFLNQNGWKFKPCSDFPFIIHLHCLLTAVECQPDYIRHLSALGISLWMMFVVKQPYRMVISLALCSSPCRCLSACQSLGLPSLLLTVGKMSLWTWGNLSTLPAGGSFKGYNLSHVYSILQTFYSIIGICLLGIFPQSALCTEVWVFYHHSFTQSIQPQYKHLYFKKV